MKYLTSDSLNSLLKPFSGWFDTGYNFMKTDVKSNEKEYVLYIDLPGVDKNNINIGIQDGYLTVEAVRRNEEAENGEKTEYVFPRKNLRQNDENFLYRRRNQRRKHKGEIRQRNFNDYRSQIHRRRKTFEKNRNRITTWLYSQLHHFSPFGKKPPRDFSAADLFGVFTKILDNSEKIYYQ